MLSGLRVLIVEDEPVLADDLNEIITEAEGVVVGPVATVKEARALVKKGVVFDVAVMDVNLTDGIVTPVLEALQARGVPIVVYTGGTVPDDVRQRHPSLVSLAKPVRPARLTGEIRRVARKAHQGAA
jgi:DNA-binding NtrC family response regulator